MDLKSLFYTIFKTLNPHNHQELTENKLLTVLKYYFFIIIFSVLLMFLLFVPQIYSARTYVEQGIEHFDNLTVSSEFSIKDSFNVLSDPLIKFDMSKSNDTKEMISITPDTVYYKKYLVFGQYKSLPLTKNVDVVSSDRAQKLISLGFFFILPSLFFWAVVLSMAYFAVIILVTYLLVITISSMLRINVSLLRLLKMCIYASTIFILLQLLLMPFFRMFILPLAAYWILVIVILFLWQDSMFKSRGNRDDKDVFGGHSSKNKGIFDDESHDFSPSKRHEHDSIHSKDHYDVDERGNIKNSGSAKRRKNFDEENEGYVELK